MLNVFNMAFSDYTVAVLNWPAFFHQSSTRDVLFSFLRFWLEWWREHDGARASYLKMSYCWADCGSDWKEEMEWITAAVGGSGIMSPSGDCVVYTVRCGCMALIHTLPYCMHRTWEDICPPLLSGSGRSVWKHISTHSHTRTQRCELPPSHSSLLLKQSSHSLKDKWS